VRKEKKMAQKDKNLKASFFYEFDDMDRKSLEEIIYNVTHLSKSEQYLLNGSIIYPYKKPIINDILMEYVDCEWNGVRNEKRFIWSVKLEAENIDKIDECEMEFREIIYDILIQLRTQEYSLTGLNEDINLYSYFNYKGKYDYYTKKPFYGSEKGNIRCHSSWQ
jgi:hypothetical protein